MLEVQMKIQQMFGNFHILELAILKHSSTIVILTFTCRMLENLFFIKTCKITKKH